MSLTLSLSSVLYKTPLALCRSEGEKETQPKVKTNKNPERRGTLLEVCPVSCPASPIKWKHPKVTELKKGDGISPTNPNDFETP